MTFDAPETQVRPVEPTRPIKYLGPLVVGVVATGILGWVGPVGPLWGALVALVTFGIFVWIDLTRHWLDAAILVGGGIVGLSFFDWVLAGRTGPVDFKLSLLAAVGWLIYGAATGVVVFRNRPGYKPTVIGFQALERLGQVVTSALQGLGLVGARLAGRSELLGQGFQAIEAGPRCADLARQPLQLAVQRRQVDRGGNFSSLHGVQPGRCRGQFDAQLDQRRVRGRDGFRRRPERPAQQGADTF